MTDVGVDKVKRSSTQAAEEIVAEQLLFIRVHVLIYS